MEWGYSLFQIGVLHSVTFAFTYVFEVPSGLIADHFGKKNELLLCFVWYMLSFACYAFGESGFWVLVLASGFYGLGEAFSPNLNPNPDPITPTLTQVWERPSAQGRTRR